MRASEHWERVCEHSRRLGKDIGMLSTMMRPMPQAEDIDPDDTREQVREALWSG